MSTIQRARTAAACLAVMLLMIGAGSAAGEQPRTLSISKEKASPGEQVFVTFTLVPAEGDEFRSVTMDVRYPKGELLFEEANPGDSVELAEGTLRTTASDDPKDPKFTVLHMVGTATKPIPGGPVSYVTFKMDKAAKGPKMINFETKAQAATQKDNAGSKPLQVLEGSVEVLLEPRVFACFFYMH